MPQTDDQIRRPATHEGQDMSGAHPEGPALGPRELEAPVPPDGAAGGVVAGDVAGAADVAVPVLAVAVSVRQMPAGNA